MTIRFNNTVYPTGHVGEDDGKAQEGTFGVDNVSTGPITINGTINQAGDPVTFSGTLPSDPGFPVPTTNNQLYATGFDNSGMLLLSNTYPPTDSSYKIVLSNTPLTDGQRVTFASDPSQSRYTPAPCFTTGTLILTARGEVAVEDLVVGDLAVTASGAERPIRWIGHRTVDCRNHAEPQNVLPVRIIAGALGENRPARDLVVSPGHNICLDVLGEVLIPATVLVNGTTIAQETVETVTYWHVELDSHDILIAEGQPAESYLDMGNRGFFVDGDVVEIGAKPDADAALRTSADYCRPYVDGGVVLDAVRAQVRARAERLGWRLEEAPFADMYLLVDGERIEADTQDLAARFVLPADATDVWLVSQTSAPREIGQNADPRQLGLCLKALTIDDGVGEKRSVALDDERLSEGFHVFEGSSRWTAGRSRLPAELFAGCRGTVFLRVELAIPALPRWVAPRQDVAEPRLHLVASAA